MNMKSESTESVGCPDCEQVLSVIEGIQGDAAVAGAVLAHVAGCEDCREAVGFVCAAMAEDRRRSAADESGLFWKGVLARLVPDVADEERDALAAAGGRDLVFQAACPKDDKGWWRAEVALPVPGDRGENLNVSVTDAQDVPLSGSFVLCSVSATIDGGKGVISLEDFRRRHNAGGVSFRVAGAKPFLRGVPVLASLS